MGIDFEAELNERQLEAVRTIEGPVLIIAGAGSGKTRVITFRIAKMLEAGIPQTAILALTFTNKAAREMSERVRSLTNKKLVNLTVSTFHAFGARVLRERIPLLGWKTNFTIYDETDRTQLIKDTARELGFVTGSKGGSAAEPVDPYAVGILFSGIKTGLKRWEGDNDRYEKLYEEYERSLKVYNAVDFDDLLRKPIELFEKFPEALDEYRNRYAYIMVDEFQDTSLIQYRMMKLLAHENVCVVGDDDQSIYSWRGANYENITNFEKDFPDRKEIKLEQNYRSTTTILEAANGVISNNTNRKEKALWTGSGEGNSIEVFCPENEVAEADFIAETIRALKLKERIPLSEFGVLIRTNSLSRHIEEEFLAQGIPYRLSGGTSFFDRREVKDIIAYLRVAANPDDDVNLRRIINTPRRGLGKKTIEDLNRIAERGACPLFSAIASVCHGGEKGIAEKEREDLESFHALIEDSRTEFLAPGSLAKKTRSLVDRVGYFGHLVSEFKRDDAKSDKAIRWRWRNIEFFLDMIEKWEKDPDNLDPGLFAWLNRISLVKRDDLDEEGDKGKVNLMTIHSAKGLEFDVVFIAGAEDGIIPHARSIEEGSLEEERRLFYVAITRAKKKLFISSCLQRRRLNQAVECAPSPFLDEIPAHLVVYHEAPEPVPESEAMDYFSRMREKFTV